MDFPTYEEVLKLKEEGVKDVWVKLSEKYGKSKDSLRSWFNREKAKRNAYETLLETESEASDDEKKEEAKHKVEESTSYDERGNVKFISSNRVILMHEEDKKDPTFVLTAHGFDPEQWILVSCLNNYWQGLRPEDAGSATLYQSKITVKPIVEKEITLSDIDHFFSNLKYENISVQKSFHSKNDDGLILEVNLADVHVGNDVVTYEELEKRISYLLEDLKLKIIKYNFKKIVVAEIGDILHFDTYNKTTTSGTHIGTKDTPYEMFDNGAKLIIWFLEELSNVCPVEFISISGNHDRFISYALAKSIEFYFKNNKNLSFDNGHEDRKYRIFGNTVVGWGHGDMGYKNMKNILQTEAREEYGKTSFAEMHVGHIHHELVKDEGSVIVRFLSSITSPDSWHKKEGYIGAKQGTMSFVWGKDGLKEIWYTGLPN